MYLLLEALRPSLPDGMIRVETEKTAKLHLDIKLWPESIGLSQCTHEQAFRVHHGLCWMSFSHVCSLLDCLQVMQNEEN